MMGLYECDKKLPNIVENCQHNGAHVEKCGDIIKTTTIVAGAHIVSNI